MSEQADLFSEIEDEIDAADPTSGADYRVGETVQTKIGKATIERIVLGDGKPWRERFYYLVSVKWMKDRLILIGQSEIGIFRDEETGDVA